MIPDDMKKNRSGGRPANHSLLLTETEFDWLRSTISKRATKATSAKSIKVRNAIQALDDKMLVPVPATEASEGFVLKLNRDELQVINTIVGNTVSTLRDKVIPEYARRAPDSPRKNEALELLVMLLALQNKGARIYDAGSHRRGNGRVQKR